MTFEKLSLHPSILKAVIDSGYTVPTPIQAQAIPLALEGHDLLASAQTGTGKTAAFVLPTLQRLTTPALGQSRGPRVLVLTPTRELANQVTDAAMKYGKHLRFRIGSVVGGVSYGPQIKLLSQPLDILVATPGRLMDHMESGRVDYSRLEVLVLDEADRMLDMGFVHAVTKIASATPDSRQTLLFSATLEGDVAKLTSRLMKNPKRIQITTVQERHESIEQRLHHVDGGEHKQSLLSHLLEDIKVEKAIVFTATKRGADRLAKRLHANGHPAAALHGNMNQNQRNRAMQSLRNGKVRLLVATDVAARGLDVSGITHVFNYDLPKNPEDYVHRIGRTGRAGAKGIAISFASPEERHQLRDIERYTRQSIAAKTIEGFEPKAVPASREHRGQGQNRPEGRHRQRQGKPSSQGPRQHRSSGQSTHGRSGSNGGNKTPSDGQNNGNVRKSYTNHAGANHAGKQQGSGQRPSGARDSGGARANERSGSGFRPQSQRRDRRDFSRGNGPSLG